MDAKWSVALGRHWAGVAVASRMIRLYASCVVTENSAAVRTRNLSVWMPFGKKNAKIHYCEPVRQQVVQQPVQHLDMLTPCRFAYSLMCSSIAGFKGWVAFSHGQLQITDRGNCGCSNFNFLQFLKKNFSPAHAKMPMCHKSKQMKRAWSLRHVMNRRRRCIMYSGWRVVQTRPWPDWQSDRRTVVGSQMVHHIIRSLVTSPVDFHLSSCPPLLGDELPLIKVKKVKFVNLYSASSQTRL